MRLPPPAIRCPASAGISGISLCIRSRMIALTEFIAVAVSERMGASEGSFTGRGWTSALMRRLWRVSARLASAESLLASAAYGQQSQDPKYGRGARGLSQVDRQHRRRADPHAGRAL